MNNIQKMIDGMVFSLGLSSESQLCSFFMITNGTISKWKARGSIPQKYLKIVEEVTRERGAAADIISSIIVSTTDMADALGIRKKDSIYTYKKKNRYLYKLIEDGLKLKKASLISQR